jgi:hypothetical protein
VDGNKSVAVAGEVRLRAHGIAQLGLANLRVTIASVRQLLDSIVAANAYATVERCPAYVLRPEQTGVGTASLHFVVGAPFRARLAGSVFDDPTEG